jgi:hypothetical protein
MRGREEGKEATSLIISYHSHTAKAINANPLVI